MQGNLALKGLKSSSSCERKIIQRFVKTIADTWIGKNQTKKRRGGKVLQRVAFLETGQVTPYHAHVLISVPDNISLIQAKWDIANIFKRFSRDLVDIDIKDADLKAISYLTKLRQKDFESYSDTLILEATELLKS